MANEVLVRIDDSELAQYVSELANAHMRVARVLSRWVRVLAKYTERKMKVYARPRTARGTGRLSSSITTEYNLNPNSLGATIFVPEKIKYQFASEYGFARKFTIRGKPKMTFSPSAWQNAMVKVPDRGYFVFTKVTRGRYKGLHFTEKAFKDLQVMVEAKSDRISSEVGNSILFSRS